MSHQDADDSDLAVPSRHNAEAGGLADDLAECKSTSMIGDWCLKSAVYEMVGECRPLQLAGSVTQPSQ